MERTGEVIALQNGRLLVEFCRPSACEKCHGCEGGAKARMKVAGQAQVGDWVVVSLPTSQVMKASALAYVIPLICLIGGLAAGNAISGDLGALLGGLAGLGLAMAGIRLWDQKRRKGSQWEARVVRVLSPSEKPGKEG